MPRRVNCRNFVYLPPFSADDTYVLDARGYVVDQFAIGEQIRCGPTKIMNAADFVARALNAYEPIDRRAEA